MAEQVCGRIRKALADHLFQQRESGFVHNSPDTETRPFALMKHGDYAGEKCARTAIPATAAANDPLIRFEANRNTSFIQ